jgi:sugar/nucleoside kinase (ribokinase family)
MPGSCFGLIGTVTYDVITNEKGTTHEGLGGILHQAAVLCGLGQEVILYTNLGRELEPEVRELTEKWESFGREGISLVPGPGNRVFLHYPLQGERVEVLKAVVPPIAPDRILNDLPHLDFLVMVLNSGFDMRLEDWRIVKENAVCPIWMDIHSLLLEKKIGCSRNYVAVADWRDWVQGIDYLQANQAEVAAMQGSPGKILRRADLEKFGREICDMGLKAVFLTMGPEGALVIDNKSARHMAAIGAKSVIDSTGCGDAFCAGTALFLSRAFDPFESALFGMRIATAVAGFSGISPIYNRIAAFAEPPVR